MRNLKAAVVGMGATGTVLAAALLSSYPETVIVGRRPELEQALRRNGVGVGGALSYQVGVRNYSDSITGLEKYDPDVIFIATKTFHLDQVLEQLAQMFRPGMKIVSTHNGLGTEDIIADRFGRDAALRMSLNYGVSLQGPGQAEVAFFNRPNHLGVLAGTNTELGQALAASFTAAGLDTRFVEDIKLHVWKKMVMKCTMASICAVTDMTIKGALEFPPTREIADTCFAEILSVAKAMGYDLGEEYLREIVAYLARVGVHKDSMCDDIARNSPTEIDFLGGKVVEYARAAGIPTPAFVIMSNLVRALQRQKA